MSPQRYDLITNYRCGSSIEEMERADDGDWVRYEDVQAELSCFEESRKSLDGEVGELNAEIVKLQQREADLRVALAEAVSLVQAALASHSTPSPAGEPK